MIVAVTGLGVCSPLGTKSDELVQRLQRGESALRPHKPLAHLPSGCDAAWVPEVDLRPILKKRKDKKLLARASALSLVAASRALSEWGGERVEMGLFWAVGREPPDDGECEAALAAASDEGRLSEVRLAGRGRDLYPPLLPLKTLPNMALAHISINLGLTGENGAWTGGAEAGIAAILAGYWALVDGRAPAVLVGGGDSQVDLGSARDRLRMGATGPPGECAAALLLEPLERAWKRAAPIYCLIEPEPPGARPGETVWSVHEHWSQLGDCGAADGPLAALICATEARRGGGHRVLRMVGTEEGMPGIRFRRPSPC